MLLALAEQQISLTGDPMPFSGRALMVSVVVVAALAAIAWALRRAAPARRGRGGILVETAAPLGERRSLVIVSVEGRRLLLGLTPSQVSFVTELGGGTPSFERTFDAATQSGGRS